MSSKQKVRVDVDGKSHDVVVGAFAQIAAKRVFGIDAIRDGDPEPVLFGVWVEMNGPPRKDSDPIPAFDAWLKKLEDFEPINEGGDEDADDPTSESSDPSPDSPPTSGSRRKVS